METRLILNNEAKYLQFSKFKQANFKSKAT